MRIECGYGSETLLTCFLDLLKGEIEVPNSGLSLSGYVFVPIGSGSGTKIFIKLLGYLCFVPGSVALPLDVMKF